MVAHRFRGDYHVTHCCKRPISQEHVGIVSHDRKPKHTRKKLGLAMVRRSETVVITSYGCLLYTNSYTYQWNNGVCHIWELHTARVQSPDQYLKRWRVRKNSLHLYINNSTRYCLYFTTFLHVPTYCVHLSTHLISN